MDALMSWLEQVEPVWRVFFLSMLPVTELRAALPLGLVWGLSVRQSFLWAVCGNLLPVPLLLIGFRWLFARLETIHFRPLTFLAERVRRHEKQIHRWGLPGLVLLVAIPLPGTGVWTGTMLAALLELDGPVAGLSVCLGAIIAGVLVALASAGVAAVSSSGGGVLGLLLAVLIVFLVFLLNKKMQG